MLEWLGSVYRNFACIRRTFLHRDGTNVRDPIVFRAALYVTSNYNQLNVCPNPLLVCYKIARDMDHNVGAHYTQG